VSSSTEYRGHHERGSAHNQPLAKRSGKAEKERCEEELHYSSGVVSGEKRDGGMMP